MNHNIMEVVAIKNVLKGEAEMTYNTKNWKRENNEDIDYSNNYNNASFRRKPSFDAPDSKHLFM